MGTDYRGMFLDELRKYLSRGSTPKMALEHLDDIYKDQMFIINKSLDSKEHKDAEKTIVVKAYGDIVEELQVLLLKYSTVTV